VDQVSEMTAYMSQSNVQNRLGVF